MWVHAFPRQLLERSGSGIWKDIQSRLLLWEDLRDDVEVVQFDLHDPSTLLSSVPFDVDRVLLEYSWWPELMIELRRMVPRRKICVRTINAEALQHYHRFGLGRGVGDDLKTLYGAWRLLLRDRQVARSADELLSISEYDDDVYWRRLSSHASIRQMPYYCPWPFLVPNDASQSTPDYEARRLAVVCLAGTNDRIGSSMVSEFERLRSCSLRNRLLSDWDFLLSAGLVGTRANSTVAGCVSIGQDFEPWPFLGQVRAVAVLGRFGFGLKTTIVDAIAAGCHVIVSRDMWNRVPDSIRQWCLLWDPSVENSVYEVAERLADSPRNGGLAWNVARRDEALDVISGLGS